MNIEYDIKEILTDLKQSINKLDTKLDRVIDDVGELKTGLVRVETDLKGEIVRVETDLKSEIVRVETDLKGEIVRVETDLKSEIVRVETDLKGEIVRVETDLKVETKGLNEKMEGLGKRIDTQEFINRSVIAGLILSTLAGFVKAFSLR